MGKTVTVLRPFVFSTPADKKFNHLVREQKFTPKKDPETGKWMPTEIELPSEVANHVWIKEHFADGCIEKPDVTAARIKTEQEKRQRESDNAARELAAAEEAMRRATGNAAIIKANAEATAGALETPVNQIGAQRGKDIDEKALEAALNTPANELAAGKVRQTEPKTTA